MTALGPTMDTLPDARQALLALERVLGQGTLGETLRELVKLRVSMLNGCAFCIDMHWRALRQAGESEQRLYGLAAWNEQPGYTARERAALGFAEVLTLRGDPKQLRAASDELATHFDNHEIAVLTYTVAAMNAWNRVCAAFGRLPAQPMQL